MSIPIIEKRKKRTKEIFGSKRKRKVEKKTEQMKKKKPTTKKKVLMQVLSFRKALSKRKTMCEKPSNSKYFGDYELPYTIDAKSVANIGRYLNHSCDPKVFVQNVFVDTPLRFPWVGFFANCYITTGSELTWDYQYKMGNVSEKHLTCHCGANSCCGRLL